MKVKDGFLVKRILDDYLVVPTGDNIVDFSAVVSLNESGAFLWQQLETEKTEAELASALMATYEPLEQSVAEEDVAEFIQLLNMHGFLDA